VSGRQKCFSGRQQEASCIRFLKLIYVGNIKLVDTFTRKKICVFIIAGIRTQYFYSTWVFWISRGCLCNRYEPCAINGKHGGTTVRWTPWLVEIACWNQHYNSRIALAISCTMKWHIYDYVTKSKCMYIILYQYPHNCI